ncbi:uncharacterized protein J7T54_007335 [Emericellopsis cladophorae]|uniref:Uncharacterized protein n=1 Tax=Emericellopsis cladophorae TaxID=2686198 RepID=A0A9P9Y054_9HYPO|nr:uncharacterized protein J7T54_007335 [Emericellopsis cladophorae]KAI6780856.1 hypothetical protein J7T54_007335 [Emericellopsis cladophorae]
MGIWLNNTRGGTDADACNSDDYARNGAQAIARATACEIPGCHKLISAWVAHVGNVGNVCSVDSGHSPNADDRALSITCCWWE